MKLLTKIFLTTALVALFTHVAVAKEGGDIGNGGGGIFRDGKYLTFGSAKIQIGAPLLTNIPGLAMASEVIEKMPLVNQAKTKIWTSLQSSGERRYFQIEKKDIEPKKYEELISKYREALKQKGAGNEIVVYAITIDKETFLLPEFYLLKEAEQAAILFHESLWVLNPDLDYKTVIDAEIAFQSYIENSNGKYGFSESLCMSAELALEDETLCVISAAQEDLKQGRLQPFLNKKGLMPVQHLLGPGDTLKTGIHYYSDFSSDQMNRYPIRINLRSAEAVRTHLFHQTTNFPAVLTFRQLLNHWDHFGRNYGGSENQRTYSDSKYGLSFELGVFGFDNQSQKQLDDLFLFSKGIEDEKAAFDVLDLFQTSRVRSALTLFLDLPTLKMEKFVGHLYFFNNSFRH